MFSVLKFSFVFLFMSSNVDLKSDFSSKEVRELHSEEKSFEIPFEVLLRAQHDVEQFFNQELPDVSEESMKWVMSRVVPGMACQMVEADAVNEEEVNDFLDAVKEELGKWIEEINKINFSRGHELSEKTYPTVEEMKTLASWLKSLSKRYSLYKKNQILRWILLRCLANLLRPYSSASKTKL